MLAIYGAIVLAATSLASPITPGIIARQDVSTPHNASLPSISIFATGGTIASKGSTNTQTVGYSVGLGVQDLIDAVPEITSIANINGYQISNVGSGSINSTTLLELQSKIKTELEKPETSGVVITHGTDTLEETAFFMELTVNSTKPVVVVGAMRPATALSADGPLNLLQAVTLACSPKAHGRGTMITLSDRIGSAFVTTKNHANSLDTFYSEEAGQLGFFINQVPYFYYETAKPIGSTYFDLTNMTTLPKVDILYAHQEMDPELFQAAVLLGAEGLVMAGVGAGGVSGAASEALETIYNATGIPIVASHRTNEGFVSQSSDDTYPIAGGFYNPQKARILLQLAIATGRSREEIKDLFALNYPM